MDEELRRLLEIAGVRTNGIENPNSSGQGHYPDHDRNPYHDVLKSHGYRYSHSTPIGARANPSNMHHTYKHVDMKDNVVGVTAPILRMGDRNNWLQPEKKDIGGHRWEVGKLGSARRTQGQDIPQLDRMLKNHVKRAAPKL